MDGNTRKRKAYLFDPYIKLTNYAKKKFKKLLNEVPAEIPLNKNELNCVEPPNDAESSRFDVPVHEFESAGRLQMGAAAEVEFIEPRCNNESDTPCTRQEQQVYPIDQLLSFRQPAREELDELNLIIGNCSQSVLEEIEELNSAMENSSINDQYSGYFQALIEDLLDGDEEQILEHLQRDNQSSNVQNLTNEQRFFEAIGNVIDKSPGELLLMVLKYSLNNKLSFSALIKLLIFVNRMCGEVVLPETRYRFNQLYKSDENVTLHGVCPNCTKYLGVFDDKILSINCTQCDDSVSVSNPSDPCFFSLIDPSDAIKEYLEEHENYYDCIMNSRTREINHIKDIYDGIAYRKFVKTLPDSDKHRYVTAVLNTDGAPAFKCSNFSIWPIYIMLNEIPVQDRFDSLIVVGMWFGKSKPEMSVILEKFVEHMNKISITGIRCKIKGVDCDIKLFVTVACVDTIARAPMNGTSQFNARDGCDWCEHPGLHHAGSMRYPFRKPPPPERNKTTTIEYARQALVNETPVVGVKSASPLLCLNGFDIIKSFTPDYMHCLLAGVTRQITDYLLEMLSQDQIDKLDDLQKKIKLPTQLGRLTRGIKERGDWKCREWENWLLYCSLPLLEIVFINKDYLDHWSLLVQSTHILLGTDITYTQLNAAKDMLNLFVKNVAKLYSLRAMTYNVHQMLHLVKSVQDWGPLWAHSAFAFESANHKLLCAVKCAKGVILQIIRYINIQRFVRTLEHMVYPNCCASVIEYCESVISSKVKKIFKLSSITYFGKENIIDAYSLLHFDVSKTTKVFSKMVFKGCLFCTSKKVNQRSCNSFAQLKDGRFIQIIDFLVDTENKVELTTCYVVNTRLSRRTAVIKEIVRISNAIVCVPTNEIATICVFITAGRRTYIVPVPNLYHY